MPDILVTLGPSMLGECVLRVDWGVNAAGAYENGQKCIGGT
jgi:hypothetical protein